MDQKPLVSCLMPTWNRRPFVSAAIDCFLRQTYEPRELLIVDDGPSVEDLVPKDERIRHIRMSQKMVTGPKRNYCCELAIGEIVCHFDDDDWSAADRVEYQVGLLQKSSLPVTGFSTLYFWDIINCQAKFYRASNAGYVCGTSLCFLKSYWEKHPFPGRQRESDNGFIYPAMNRKLIASSPESRYMVARLHGHHTSPKGNIRTVCSRDLLPKEFWENEKRRLTLCPA